MASSSSVLAFSVNHRIHSAAFLALSLMILEAGVTRLASSSAVLAFRAVFSALSLVMLETR